MKKVILILICSVFLLTLSGWTAEKKTESKQLEKEPVKVDEKFCKELKVNLLKLKKKWKDCVKFEVEDEFVFRVKFYPPELNNSKSSYSSLDEIEITDKDKEKAEKKGAGFSQTMNKAFIKIKEKPFVEHYLVQVCRTFKSINIKSAYFTKEADMPFAEEKDQVLFEGEFLLGEKKEFMDALELIESGDYEEGINKLREFIKNNPDSPLVYDAHLKISEVFEDLAEEVRTKIKPSLPDYGYRDRAAFERIKTLIKMSKRKQALSAIKQFKRDFPLSRLNDKMLGLKL